MIWRPLILGVAGLAVATAVAAGKDESNDLQPAASFARIADRNERSRALFGEMSRVIHSPRCLDCHPATRQPLQRDGLPHVPAVDMTDQSPALACATCHHDHNTPGFGGGIDSIPGAPGWQLAPASMAWVGKSPAEICHELKDPARNGHRDLAALQRHMAEDRLVGWAWQPGLGRKPAPGTQAQFGNLASAWIASGAQCPGD